MLDKINGAAMNGVPIIGGGQNDQNDERHSDFQGLLGDMLRANQKMGMGQEPARKAINGIRAVFTEYFGGSGQATASDLLAVTSIIFGNVVAEYLWEMESAAGGSNTPWARRARVAAVRKLITTIANDRIEHEAREKRSSGVVLPGSGR